MRERDDERPLDLRRFARTLKDVETTARVGRVRAVVGTVMRVTMPSAAVGELVAVERVGGGRCLAQVVGFIDDEAILTPLDALEGVATGARAARVAAQVSAPVGRWMLGRVVDAMGAPIDGGPPPPVDAAWALERPAPRPLTRRPIEAALVTGLRVLDGPLMLGHGQRVGLLAPPGAGKSTLLAELARSAAVDVVIVGLVGERGREVRDFVHEGLGAAGRARSVVVVATGDEPAQRRVQAAWLATAVGEYFRDQHGARVLLLIDSLTRLARAQREVALAAGEPPARQGYPASLSGVLARLIERAGNSAHGCMTALYTLLTSRGQEESVAEEVRGLLDGHIELSSTLANHGHWPAVDVLRSLSRLLPSLASAEHLADAQRLRRMLAVREAHDDLLALGAYRAGSRPELDEVLERWHEIEAFLKQPLGEPCPLADTLDWLGMLAE